MSPIEKRRITDPHLHLYDNKENHYEFLEHVDPVMRALIGDYSALPRDYLLPDYLKDEPNLDVVGLVWSEFLSSDPIREVRWAQKLADTSNIPIAIVGLIDCLNPDLQSRLDTYAQLPNVAGVREHLAWDVNNPLRRSAKRPDLLTDSRWLQGLNLLSKYKFDCCLEVFSSQLPDLLTVIRSHPQINFTIGVMGWPIATDQLEFARWKQNLAGLSSCHNVRIVVSALECIFGMAWTVQQAYPWVQTVFDLFGPGRTMFGSHHPVCGLSKTFPSPYPAYEEMPAGLSSSEKDAVFNRNAHEWFFSTIPKRM